MDEFIKDLTKDMPPFLTPHDLVSLGLYPSVDAAYLARARGYSPDYIKNGRKILYPKSTIIEFLKKRMRSGSPNE